MILDTSILVDILKNRKSTIEKIEKIGEKANTTVISEYELLKDPDESTVTGLLNAFKIYEFSSPAAERCGKIYKQLRDGGNMINEMDILIASIAISNDELLVTKDKDFKKVDDLKVLVL